MKSVVTMLPVGQGAMNLIEIYDDYCGKEILVNLTLIDCGSADGRNKAGDVCENSLEYAVDKMKERWDISQATREYLYLDTLIITHKDLDHWNLLQKLFSKLVGGDASIIDADEKVGMLEIMVSEVCTQTLYANCLNEKSEIYRHQISYVDECEIAVQYNQENAWNSRQVEFEYSFGDMVLWGSWKTGNLVIWLDSPDLTYKMLAYTFLEKTYLEVGEEPREYEAPTEMDAFLFLLSKVMCAIGIATEHFNYIGEMVKNLCTDGEAIKKIIESNKNTKVPFIGNVYIGGNIFSSGTRFKNMEQFLRKISRNPFSIAGTGSSIDLYGAYNLLIIQRMSIFDLEDIPGAASKTSPSIKNNATSIVCALHLSGDENFQKVIFTGDATVHTFYRVLQDMDREPRLIQECANAVWTAPHHGAWRTLQGEIEIGEDKVSVFSVILIKTHPNGMIISAGVENKYGHPDSNFIQMMCSYWSYGTIQVDNHAIYLCGSDNAGTSGRTWGFMETTAPLYTLYTKDNTSGAEIFKRLSITYPKT